MKKMIILAAAGLAIGIQARAALYDLTFDIQGNSGYGVLTISPNGLVTAASVWVTTGDWASATPYSLAPNNYNYGTFNGYGQSSVGHFTGGEDFIYDNIVYLNHTPLLDNDGLTFWTASQLQGAGFNIWGNSGATDYTFAGAGAVGNPILTGGTVTITAVPETSTLLAGAMLLLPLSMSTLRMLRKSRTA